MTRELLRIDSLRAGYGHVEVLHGVSLTVPRGQIVAIVGPNGAGKTSLFDCISGVNPATSGVIKFKDREIQGLRAVAVAVVVVCHFWPSALPGGFVGVDVFFVISGYLITGLILQRHAEGRFSLLDFYERRIRRIFPALFLVLFATMAFGAAIMLPPRHTPHSTMLPGMPAEEM